MQMCTKDWSEFGKPFSLLVNLPPFPHQKVIISLFISDVSLSCYSFNSSLADICGTYCSSTNQDWQTQQRPYCTFSGPAVNIDSSEEGADRPEDVVYKLFTGGVMVSSLREASWFSLPVPSHLTTFHWPLQLSPKYLWLTSMHRLNPFYPAAPLGITCSLRKWEELEAEGGSTLCVSKPLILYPET